jgi:hypothetical protein
MCDRHRLKASRNPLRNAGSAMCPHPDRDEEFPDRGR